MLWIFYMLLPHVINFFLFFEVSKTKTSVRYVTEILQMAKSSVPKTSCFENFTDC